MDHIHSNDKGTPRKDLIPVYYENQMNQNYRLEERIIKNIIYSNTKCLQSESKLNLIFYYKSPKASSLVMKNNMSPYPTLLQQSSVIYKFCCPLPHSQAVEYVGLTQTTLSRRLMYHAQDGGICKHFKNCHEGKPTKAQLTENTTIIARATDRLRLSIKEALYIIKLGPLINKQYDNFTNILKLYNHRNHAIKSNTMSHTHQKPLNPPFKHQDLTFPHNQPFLSTLPSIPPSNNHLSSDLAPPPNPISPSQPSSLTIPISPNLNQLPPPNLSSPSQPPSPTIHISPNLDLAPRPNLVSPSQPSSPTIPTSPNLDLRSPFSLTSTSQPSSATTYKSSNLKLPGYQYNTNKDSRNLSLPDMSETLKSFGIDPSKLKLVPLVEYDWRNTSSNLPVTSLSPTISQRIRSMARAARHKVK